MHWDIIILGLIVGASIGMAINEYRRLPSHKTLPQEIAELATKEERERIIKLLQEAIDKAELYAEETYGLFEAIELIKGENK